MGKKAEGWREWRDESVGEKGDGESRSFKERCWGPLWYMDVKISTFF